MYSPEVKICFCPKRENNGRTKQNGILKRGIRGYEACISQISCKKAGVIILYSRKEYWNHPCRKSQIERTKIPQT
jgi:hypothetical protein